MQSIGIEQTRKMMIAACDAVIENKPYLTEIDSKIGDGDHGIGMAGGMGKAREALLNKQELEDVNDVFKTTGMAMLNSMGGASGVIFGTMFLGGIKGKESMKELSCVEFSQIMKAALEAVKKRGQAQLGDKTMVDALEPAVCAMEKEKDDFIEMLRLGSEAAEKGVENTKQYVAKFGRAKSLMERSLGHQDAGATSVAIIFKAMHEYLANS